MRSLVLVGLCCPTITSVEFKKIPNEEKLEAIKGLLKGAVSNITLHSKVTDGQVSQRTSQK